MFFYIDSYTSAIGNLTSKSDFSTTAANAYVYTGGSCGGGPNAVKSVALKAGGSRTYCYDAAGNLTGDNASLSVRYDHTQRPLRIARGTINQSFDYAPSGEKFRESGTDGEVAFFGKLERRYSPTAQDKLYAASNAVYTQTATGAVTVQFLLTDRLGSVGAVADSSGTLAETRGYDAFGKPRTGTWADATPPRLGTTANTPHGFTGHEHLNSLELIHMNGRVYDYNLGRFMEVDPIIQSPFNSQSLNPYSYIGNNPLSGTDPTGYFGEGLPCIMPTWACRQQVTGQGPDEEFGFTATMAKLGLSQGGRSSPPRVSNFNGAQSLAQLQKNGELDKLLANAQRSNNAEIGGMKGAVELDQAQATASGSFPVAVTQLPSSAAVVAASASGGKTIYYRADGTVEVRSGSRPWRNNNPGNLRKGSAEAPSTKRAIAWDASPTRRGDTITQLLPFAVFASYEEGRMALAETLARTYSEKNVAQTIQQYAPTNDGNNSAMYSNYILTHGGISQDATIGQLSPSQLNSAMDAIEHFEGFSKGGTVETYYYPGPF